MCNEKVNEQTALVESSIVIGKRGADIQSSVTPVEGIGERKPVYVMEQVGKNIFYNDLYIFSAESSCENKSTSFFFTSTKEPILMSQEKFNEIVKLLQFSKQGAVILGKELK